MAQEPNLCVEVALTDPDYIVYLFDPKQEYNCYFIVGNPELGPTERIGVVKKMLLAHSKVLRLLLQDSKIAEKGDVKLLDVFPRTFKNLMRFVYGHDITQMLSFNDADNLLYVAEKYMMPNLKNRLATRLISMLDYNNICSLLNNPACYNELQLKSAITEILQTETNQVLTSPCFPDLSPNGFLKILEQEICNVAEIELWRSAIDWAKSRGGSEDGNVLRSELNEHLKHIRVCSMSDEEILTEVLTKEVLTRRELKFIGETRKTRKAHPNLKTVCNKVMKRVCPFVVSELTELSLRCGSAHGNSSDSKFKLRTEKAGIELCSVELDSSEMEAHKCKCTISVRRDGEPPDIVEFQRQINKDSSCLVPLLIENEYVRLLPNSNYLINFKFSCSSSHVAMHPSFGFSLWVTGDHFTVHFESNSTGNKVVHVKKIWYKTLTQRVETV
ncbi:uncharacterized protein LOC129003974 [Macrosteles quadrilineatus]|uniref:uncharacterized protein LOC129003974 n=1 Tax=Macrosteles quadrilineatus TaxID=74068 RepID=UPI0023E30E55|nr:uncharacterized protein LOC129003974 [Macrosteles quadrilineatus]